MFEVRNDTKKVSELTVGELVVYFDKVYRVLEIWPNRYDKTYTVDLEGDGDCYEHWEADAIVNVITIYVDLTKLAQGQDNS